MFMESSLLGKEATKTLFVKQTSVRNESPDFAYMIKDHYRSIFIMHAYTNTIHKYTWCE